MSDDKNKDYINNKGVSSNDSDGYSAPEDDKFYKYSEMSDMEDADEDLLALLDMISAQDDNNQGRDEIEEFYKSENEKLNGENETSGDMNLMDMDYLNMENLDDSEVRDLDFDNETIGNLDIKDAEMPSSSSEDDIIAIDDFTNQLDETFGGEDIPQEKSDKMGNVSDVFSNVLSALDSLEDEDLINDNSNNDAINKSTNENQDKVGILQKIFGKKEAKDDSAKADKTVKSKNAKKSKDKQAKTVKAESLSEQKSENNKEDEKEEALKAKKAAKKAEAAKKKAEKKEANKLKAAARAEVLKARKAKRKEAQKIAEEVNEEEKFKLNRLAVIFIATFFILIGGFVIIGTNSYSYSLNIKNAKIDFGRKRYTEAYNKVYGLNIKKKDKTTYDKIKTVMYVNKELNSYNNYVNMNKYPEALDSLLKGLERYDKNIDQAKELGIEEDLNYVRDEIVKGLDDTFKLSEEQAVTLNSIEDQSAYSINVINAAIENAN